MGKGDQLVFKTLETTDPHFKNFIYGKVYTIKSSTLVSLGHDEDAKPEMAVFFEECSYGCYITYLSQHFSTLEDFRDINIKKIIND